MFNFPPKKHEEQKIEFRTDNLQFTSEPFE